MATVETQTTGPEASAQPQGCTMVVFAETDEGLLLGDPYQMLQPARDAYYSHGQGVFIDTGGTIMAARFTLLNSAIRPIVLTDYMTKSVPTCPPDIAATIEHLAAITNDDNARARKYADLVFPHQTFPGGLQRVAETTDGAGGTRALHYHMLDAADEPIGTMQVQYGAKGLESVTLTHGHFSFQITLSGEIFVIDSQSNETLLLDTTNLFAYRIARNLLSGIQYQHLTPIVKALEKSLGGPSESWTTDETTDAKPGWSLRRLVSPKPAFTAA